nr:TraM recognition domain-containing protein [Actinomyces sp.]
MTPRNFELELAFRAAVTFVLFVISGAVVMRVSGVSFNGLTGAVTAFPSAGRGVHVATAVLTVLLLLAWWGISRGLVAFLTNDGGKREPKSDMSDMYLKAATAHAEQTIADAQPGLPPQARGSSVDLVRFMGVYGKKALYESYESPECIYAVTRSGKTRSLVARRVLEAAGPVVATSTKVDGIALTWLGLALDGRKTFVFDPMEMAHGPLPLRWDPIQGCGDFDTARRRAMALVSGASTRTSGGGNTRWFMERGAQILGYLMHAAALSGQNMTAVHRWVTRPDDARAVLERYGTPTSRMMAATLADLMIEMAAETSSGFKGTMQGALEPLMVDSVLEVLTPPPHESFDVQSWLASRDVIWVLSPESEGAVASITTMFTDHLLDAAKRAANHVPGSRLVPAVSAILDEAANVAALPHLDALFSEGPGRGIFTCAVFQDNAQVEARWGRDIARIVFQQARAVYVLGGSKDAAWNKKIAELSVEYEEARHSYSTGRMGASVSTTTQRRHLLREGQIATLPVGKAVLASAGHDAVIVELPDIATDKKWGQVVREGSRMYGEHLAALNSAATDTQREFWKRDDARWMTQHPLPR